MYHLYILINLQKTKTYVGVTKDLDRRLNEHNQGKVSFTSKFRPFEILHKEMIQDIKEAYAREKFYKTTSGRRKIKEFFNKVLE